MNQDQRKENMRMLAAILGLQDEEAAILLAVSVQVSWAPSDKSGALLGEFVATMLERTFVTVGTPTEPAIDPFCELCVNGVRSVAPGATQVRACIDRQGLHVGRNVELHVPPAGDAVPRVLALLAACFACAAVADAALGLPAGWTSLDGIHINFAEWPGVPLDLFEQQVALGRCFLAGAGAVGNAVTYALQYLNTTGELVVVDPKKVSASIINRCLWFDDFDVGRWKAECLSDKFARETTGMIVRPFMGTLQEYRLAHHTEYECLIVGVDSRLARRRLQEEVPREVFDASTTGVEEVVFHHNVQHSGMACLGCVYYETDGERSFAQHVAEALDVSIDEVDAGFITEGGAARIAARYPELQQAELIGKAFDTIFKQLCATQSLRTAEQQQVLAPFAFVSQLAGTITAIELFLRRHTAARDGQFNYWRVSPWRGLNVDLQQNLSQQCDCSVCVTDDYRAVASDVWKRA